MVEALLTIIPLPLVPAQLIVNEPCAVLTNWPCSAKRCKGFAYGHFPVIIGPSRAVEMQQGDLQRVSDWSRPFQLPNCGCLVFNSASPMEPRYMLAAFCVTIPGRLIGVLRPEPFGGTITHHCMPPNTVKRQMSIRTVLQCFRESLVMPPPADPDLRQLNLT
jgi:hypothetical protein